MRLSGLGDLHPTTRRLLLTRALRSIGQGVLVVDWALYLNALGWSGVAIGAVLSGSGLFGAMLSLLVGLISDRLRRKPFLLVYEAVSLFSSIAALLTAQPAILVSAAIASGFGRGANGAAGPFSPAEQAWLAEEVAPQRRGRVYSLNTAMGFFGMALGALVAILPSVWGGWLGGALAYRPLFALVAVTAVGNLVLLGQAHEEYRGPVYAATLQEHQRETQIRRQENRALEKLVFVNSFNGVAIGLIGPLISYWFAVRFSVGPSAIAPMMALAFAVTGVSSLLTGKLTERIGLVRSVVGARLVGLALLVLLPLMPTYGLASLVYLLRSAFNRGSLGARQALTVGLVRDERRGLATSLNAVSAQLPQSVGPTIAGYLLDVGQLTLPFYIAVVLQGIYLVSYERVFRHYEPLPQGPSDTTQSTLVEIPAAEHKLNRPDHSIR
jgi:MFS family permease